MFTTKIKATLTAKIKTAITGTQSVKLGTGFATSTKATQTVKVKVYV